MTPQNLTPQHPAIQNYLRALESALFSVPSSSREAILDDVSAHLADAIESGRDPEDAIAALGAPETVANDARDQFGVAAAVAPADHAARMLHLCATVLAVVTAILVSFLLPSYALEELGLTRVATGSTLQTATTVFEQFGLGVALLPLIAAALAALPLIVPTKARHVAAWTNAAVFTMGSVALGLTIGGFFAPLALMAWAAVLVPAWIRRGGSPIVGRIWRVAGALFIIAPAAYALGGIVTGSLVDGSPAFWIVLLVVIILGILFGLRVRFLDLTVAVLGAALMTLGVLDAGLLMLAFWWAGGLWLVIGLSATSGRRRTPPAQ